MKNEKLFREEIKKSNFYFEQFNKRIRENRY